MRGVGTDEPWVIEEMTKQLGDRAVAVHYRRPLRIDEINRMAPTNAVRSRPATMGVPQGRLEAVGEGS
jgi:hypothetical protein